MFQAPLSQAQLLIVTTTLLSARDAPANVTSSPNSLKAYASAPTLGRLLGSGLTVASYITSAAGGGGPASPGRVAVRAEVAVFEPAGFVAVTRILIVNPTSAAWTTYVSLVAPAIGMGLVQEVGCAGHRHHWYA